MRPNTCFWRLIRALLFGLTAVGCVCIAQGEPAAGDWPQWRGPRRDGISTEKDWFSPWPSGGPKVLWKAQVGRGHSSVAVVGDRVYTTGFLWSKASNGQINKGNDGKQIGSQTVWCLDADSGHVEWKHSYSLQAAPSGARAHATPTVDKGLVYSISVLGKLVCLDGSSGKVVWCKDLAKDFNGKMPYYGYSCSPLVVKDLLVVEVGGLQGRVVAVERKTGQTAWIYQLGKGDSAGHSSPVAYEEGGKHAIVMCMPRTVVGISAEDGKELWRYPTPFGCNSTPVLSGDKLFFSASGPQRRAVLLQLGQGQPKVVWNNKEMTQCFQSSILVDGHLYGTHAVNSDSKRAVLRCVSFSSGEVKWEREGFGHAALVSADGKLIILDERGELVVAEAAPQQFKELARAKVLNGRYCWACPVLCHGRIYCRSEEGELVCLDVRKP